MVLATSSAQKRGGLLCLVSQHLALAMWRLTLEPWGYTVIPLSSAEEAQQEYASLAADAILVEGDTSEDYSHALGQLRRLNPELPVIVFSDEERNVLPAGRFVTRYHKDWPMDVLPLYVDHVIQHSRQVSAASAAAEERVAELFAKITPAYELSRKNVDAAGALMKQLADYKATGEKGTDIKRPRPNSEKEGLGRSGG
jgi:DNA-binding NarL/FixJ family response regulator